MEKPISLKEMADLVGSYVHICTYDCIGDKPLWTYYISPWQFDLYIWGCYYDAAFFSLRKYVNLVIFVLVYRPCRPLVLAFEVNNKANLPICYCSLLCLLLGILNVITKSKLSFLILITAPKMPNLSLMPLKPSCHAQHDMGDAVLKYAIDLLNK